MRICIGIAISALSFGCVGTIGERASDDGDGVDGGDTINGRVYKPAAGLSVRDVALYQGVRVDLVSNGEKVTDQSKPIVAKAPASIFAYVDVGEDFAAREITARLSVSEVDGSTWQTEVTHEVAGASEDSSPQTPTFTFEVEADVIQTESGFSVELFEGDDVARSQGDTDGYRFPLDGVSELGAETTGGAFNLVLVPFRYNVDGSNRLPPLDEATIEVYRDYFTAMLPVESLNLTVRDPVDYNRSISSGNGWSAWLDTLVQIRTQDSPPPNTYYYGVAAPAATFASIARVDALRVSVMCRAPQNRACGPLLVLRLQTTMEFSQQFTKLATLWDALTRPAAGHLESIETIRIVAHRLATGPTILLQKFGKTRRSIPILWVTATSSG